ncbi:MAG: hypothetical protein HY888_09805 [Deltaproteobacteria bacterium]|nr:hypothetical protein [Deltaproteobacteria bacterium]
MDESKNTIKENDKPATPLPVKIPPATDTAVEPEKAEEKEIEIRQVPVDGVCGGY